jgi:predicted DNA binding CopG/RHH family protein
MRKSKKKYKDEPIGKIKIVDDFLPQPKDLILKQETTKVTISLTKSSVDFFRDEAKKHHVSYQVMIRELIDQYASRFA